MNSIVFNSDCVEGMKQFPDKYFDLAVVDPPYGIGEHGGKCRTRKRHKNHVVHAKKNWDSKRPTKKYFKELFRVSKNQIIWGGNYFVEHLKPKMGWIYWDKLIGGDFSDGELAYTSFERALKKFTKSIERSRGKFEIQRIHPTQKPIALYDWLYLNYAEEGMKILDTHLGSGSNRISAHKYKMDFTAFEIDKEYFDKQEQRYRDFISQTVLF